MAAPGQTNALTGREPGGVLVWQVAFGILLLVVWELAGRFISPTWIGQPSLIGLRLVEWSSGDLIWHVGTTLGEMLIGMAIGIPAGVLCGMWLGRSPVASNLLRPIIVALYSVPLVTLAPLLILWFGLDMEPKIVLVSVVVFFMLFFNTFAGVQTMDKDLILSLQLMGANPREQFQKLIAPACIAWIMSGMKNALPYALVAATVGEMLAARRGLGYLIARASSQFDMNGLYTALFVLMVLGMLIGEGMVSLERFMLRWRHAAE